MTAREDTELCRRDPRARRFTAGGDCTATDPLPCLKTALWTVGGKPRCTQHAAADLRR